MGQARGVGGQDWSHWWIEDDGVTELAPKVDKPPYSVPTMTEVAAVRGTNGLKVVSTFSGCGGSCLGFEMAGYEVLYASEFIPEARETYAANHPGVFIDPRDIREVTADDILAKIGLERGQLDVLEGSPPCASFSTAGSRSKKWGQTSAYSSTAQRSDDLFFEYARLVEGIQPRVFIAENVSGLVKGVAKGYFQEIIARLRDCGYRVAAQVLDAQWLGVPQQRHRVIFVGVRDDIDREPAFPVPLTYRYTLRDALSYDGVFVSNRELRRDGDPERDFADAPAGSVMARGVTTHDYAIQVVHDTSGNGSLGDVTDRPCPGITVGVNNVNSRHWQVVAERYMPGGAEPRPRELSLDAPALTVSAEGIGNGFAHQTAVITDDGQILDPETGARIDLGGTAIAPEYDKIAQGETSDKFFNLARASDDAPSPTVTQAAGGRGTAGVAHPSQRRKFTLVELRRICAFPEDFILTGTYAQRWERLGRAVPPLMMRAVAETVRDQVLA